MKLVSLLTLFLLTSTIASSIDIDLPRVEQSEMLDLVKAYETARRATLSAQASENVLATRINARITELKKLHECPNGTFDGSWTLRDCEKQSAPAESKPTPAASTKPKGK